MKSVALIAARKIELQKHSIPKIRSIDPAFVAEIINGEIQNNTVKAPFDIACDRLRKMGLEVKAVRYDAVRGVCWICGDDGSPFTQDCDGDKHNAYYDELERNEV